jgi:hypothetical protein
MEDSGRGMARVAVTLRKNDQDNETTDFGTLIFAHAEIQRRTLKCPPDRRSG